LLPEILTGSAIATCESRPRRNDLLRTEDRQNVFSKSFVDWLIFINRSHDDSLIVELCGKLSRMLRGLLDAEGYKIRAAVRSRNNR
jgi:hypothetical protein